MKEKIMVEAIKSVGNLYCKTGRQNAYRRAFKDGLGATRKEFTWNKYEHHHTCCGSKVCWRHKTFCKLVPKNAPDDLSDLKDI